MSTSAGTRSSSNASRAPRVAGDQQRAGSLQQQLASVGQRIDAIERETAALLSRTGGREVSAREVSLAAERRALVDQESALRSQMNTGQQTTARTPTPQRSTRAAAPNTTVVPEIRAGKALREASARADEAHARENEALRAYGEARDRGDVAAMNAARAHEAETLAAYQSARAAVADARQAQEARTGRSAFTGRMVAPRSTRAAAYRSARKAALNAAPTIRTYRNNQPTTIRQPESRSQKAQRLAPAVMSRARVEAERTAKMTAQLKTANTRLGAANTRYTQAQARQAHLESPGNFSQAAYQRAMQATDNARAAQRAAQSARDSLQARVTDQQRRADQYERFNFPAIRPGR